MKIAFLILFGLISLIVNKADAQVGYIVTQKGDTLKGEFKTSAFGRPKFKAVNSTATVSVNLDTITGYQLSKDGSIFVAKLLPSTSMNLIAKPQFVQLLERGKINLYQQVGTDRYQLRTWYVSKNTDSLIAIKTDDVALVGGGSKKSRKEILSAMFGDQPDILAAFNATGKFDFETILAYIHKYNLATNASNK